MSPTIRRLEHGFEAEIGFIGTLNGFCAEIAGEEDEGALEIDGGVVAQAEVALSRMPSRSRVMEGAAFSISSNRMSEMSLFSLATPFTFACVSMGCVSRWPKIAGRRADEFGDFVLHLKFAAINFEKILAAAVQHFGERFHRARFARSGWAQQ